jgi:DNA-binding transcriptional ArsR family regulator
MKELDTQYAYRPATIRYTHVCIYGYTYSHMTSISTSSICRHGFLVLGRRTLRCIEKFMTKKAVLVVGDLQEMAEILKAISHNERLAIARLLSQSSEGRLTVKAIYEKLNLPQPIVSRHLTIMKGAGIVKRLQEGQRTYYSLRKEKKTVENLAKCFCR